MKEERVEDPIARVSFPGFAAGVALEWQGQKFDFLGEEARREFAEENKIAFK
jgi:hypothetical protein